MSPRNWPKILSSFLWAMTVASPDCSHDSTTNSWKSDLKLISVVAIVYVLSKDNVERMNPPSNKNALI